MPIDYRPLCGQRNEIRVIELLPAEDEAAPLQSTLKHVKLTDANYQALSYVWGDSKDPDQLEVEYQYIDPLSAIQSTSTSLCPIGQNLASALLHLRDKNSTLRIWVDAICINQFNNSEKSAQVAMMAEIYKTAVQVIIWLGPAADGVVIED